MPTRKRLRTFLLFFKKNFELHMGDLPVRHALLRRCLICVVFPLLTTRDCPTMRCSGNATSKSTGFNIIGGPMIMRPTDGRCSVGAGSKPARFSQNEPARIAKKKGGFRTRPYEIPNSIIPLFLRSGPQAEHR